jgi:hypothetical protein
LYGLWSSPAFPPTLGFFSQPRQTKELLVAKVVKARKHEVKHKSFHDENMPLDPVNFKIIGTGVVVIVLGYLAMISGGIEGFLPLVLSPVLLVLGYCVIIPVGILYRKGGFSQDAGSESEAKTAN